MLYLSGGGIDNNMTVTNRNGEIADLLNVNQFIGGRSAYECVAYCAALAKYAGAPGKGPTGTAQQASDLAQSWYAREEGGNGANNTNGMSLQAEYNMLQGLGMVYQPLAANANAVRAALAAGHLVLLCGAETGMYDMALGRVPYAWTPSGNHCIVASGIAPDGGNLLVHDCASIAPNGVRPGPRLYSAGALQIVSATAIIPPWLSTTEDLPMLQLSDPMGRFFSESNGRWTCNEKNTTLAYALLDFWRQYGGVFGLPITNELYLAQYQPNTAVQVCERAIMAYDPDHKIDNVPGAGSCYLIHIDGGIGQQIIAKPLLSALQAQVDDLNGQIAQLKQNPGDPATVAALQTQLTSYKQAVNVVRQTINGY